MIKNRFDSIKSYIENLVDEQDKKLRAEIAEEVISELDKMEDLVELLDEGDDGDPETWAASISENLETLLDDEE